MPDDRDNTIVRLNARIKELEDERARADSDVDNIFSLHVESMRMRGELQALERENATLRGSIKSANFAGPNQMVITPRQGSHYRLDLHRTQGYVLMPFGPSWSGGVYDAIARAFARSGRSCQRADRETGPDIMDDVWRGICHSGVIVADVTGCNPNVMYELGLADVLGKRIVLVSQTADPTKIAFDLLGLRLIVYDTEGLSKLTSEIEHRLKQDTW